MKDNGRMRREGEDLRSDLSGHVLGELSGP